MGIEPTWDFVESHAGFEDQERHQIALRLPNKLIRLIVNEPERAEGIAAGCRLARERSGNHAVAWLGERSSRRR